MERVPYSSFSSRFLVPAKCVSSEVKISSLFYTFIFISVVFCQFFGKIPSPHTILSRKSFAMAIAKMNGQMMISKSEAKKSFKLDLKTF